MIDVVAGVAVQTGSVLLCQRWPSDVPEWSEKWCLAGGKIEPGEQPEDALRREWLEELRAIVQVGELLTCTIFRVAGRADAVRVRTYEVSILNADWSITSAGGQAARWVRFGRDFYQIDSLASTREPVEAYLALHPEAR